MDMKKLMNVHPGEILSDVIEELGISTYRLAKETHMPASNLYDIIAGKRGITADISVRLGRFFEQSDQFWLNIQNSYEFRKIQHEREKEFATIRSYKKVI
ncbi:HigA family addiction module antitoxin [Leptospira santarosai]|uniref:HigA family addiction module antitoxin n=1 Tax=Leptospira santarosai TaxID=28183 RepID=UPI0024AEDBB3|nr:HigA family addiction module antitoxin [Leptospira santarosai]MDI7166718.1 HigA family addiction module antitoxin [Leptospira santarosai]